MRRRVHAGRGPDEQRIVKMLAEFRQTHANGRLAEIEILGRLRHASGFVQLGNHGQQLQVDIGHAENTRNAGVPP